MRNSKKEVAKPQTCGNLRNELHESTGAGAIRIFLANVKTRYAENTEVKECVISQFHEVGGPDT